MIRQSNNAATENTRFPNQLQIAVKGFAGHLCKWLSVLPFAMLFTSDAYIFAPVARPINPTICAASPASGNDIAYPVIVTASQGTEQRWALYNAQDNAILSTLPDIVPFPFGCR